MFCRRFLQENVQSVFFLPNRVVFLPSSEQDTQNTQQDTQLLFISCHFQQIVQLMVLLNELSSSYINVHRNSRDCSLWYLYFKN